jgi:hypothetical protein
MKKLILLLSIFSLNVFAADTTATQKTTQKFPSREEMRAKIEAFKTKCEADIAALCEEEKGPEAMKCMIDNFDKIEDESCQALVKEVKNNPPPKLQQDRQDLKDQPDQQDQ